MYLFFNREKEPFRMEKGRSLVTNIDRKGKWRLDTGGDKKKKLTMLKRGCSLFCGYCLLFCGNRKKHRLKRKNGMRKKTGIKYKTWILKFDIYTKLWTRQKSGQGKKWSAPQKLDIKLLGHTSNSEQYHR